MPLYEYKCDACSRAFEVTQKFSDAPLTECEICKGPVQKLISRTSFQLKGTGWYASDYKKTSENQNSSFNSNTSTSCPSPSGCGKKDQT